MTGATVPNPGEPSLFSRLARGTSWQALAQMSPLVFNLALTPYLIHGLGVELYGIFLLVSVIQLFVGSVDGGVGASARRFFGIYVGRNDRAAMTSLLTTLFVIMLTGATVLSCLLFAAAPQIMAFFPGAAADPAGAVFLLRVMVVLAAFAQVRELFTQVLLTANQFRITALGDLMGFFAYATGMVLAVQNGLGLVGVGWAFIAQQCFPTLMVLPAALRRLDWTAIRFVPRHVLGEFFRYAWKIQVSGTLAVLSAQGDSVFVGRFAAPQMTSYGTGASFASTMRGIPWNATIPMDANIVRAIGEHGPEGAIEQVTKIQRLWVRVVAGWIAVGVPASGFGVVVWLHLGTDLPGQVAAAVLLAHGATMALQVQRFWLNGLGRSGLTLSHDVLNTAINLSLTFPLIIHFGVIGTISATLIAALSSAIYLTWVARRRVESRLPTPWSEVPWFTAVMTSALTAGCCWLTTHFLVGVVVPYGPLALLVVGASAAPALALYLLHIVGLRRLRELLLRIRSRRRG